MECTATSAAAARNQLIQDVIKLLENDAASMELITVVKKDGGTDLDCLQADAVQNDSDALDMSTLPGRAELCGIETSTIN